MLALSPRDPIRTLIVYSVAVAGHWCGVPEPECESHRAIETTGCNRMGLRPWLRQRLWTDTRDIDRRAWLWCTLVRCIARCTVQQLCVLIFDWLLQRAFAFWFRFCCNTCDPELETCNLHAACWMLMLLLFQGRVAQLHPPRPSVAIQYPLTFACALRCLSLSISHSVEPHSSPHSLPPACLQPASSPARRCT